MIAFHAHFGPLITEAASLIAAAGTFISGVALWQVSRVRHEVRTYNDLTLGRASDATETRRIQAIPEPARTSKEWEHLSTDD